MTAELDEKDFYRKRLESTRRKLMSLPQNSPIRLCLTDELSSVSERIERNTSDHLKGMIYAPLYLLIEKLGIEEVRHLESDMNLVFSKTAQAKQADVLLFLKEIHDTRRFRSSIFELFAKSRALNSYHWKTDLDVPISAQGNRDSDMRLSKDDREIFLECNSTLGV